MFKKFSIPILLVCWISWALPSSLTAQGRSIVRVPARTESGETREIELYSGYHALVIGCGDYRNGWSHLSNPVKDAKEVASTLEKLGWQVTLSLDPNKAGLDEALYQFADGPGNDPNAAILIWFSGHGHTLEEAGGTKLGYLVPVDAPDPSLGRTRFVLKAVSMRQIESLARLMRARHVLMLFDSCFSGAVFQAVRGLPSPFIQEKVKNPVRQFITAGTEDEVVPDRSVFKTVFLQGIEQGFADRNQDRYITGEELGTYISEQVANYSKGAQHPKVGKMNDPKLDKGDFVFLAGGESDSTEEPAPPAPEEKKKWAVWQEKIESEYHRAEALDRDPGLSSQAKMNVWRTFLSIFTQNNPESLHDDALINMAQKRLAHWEKNLPSTAAAPPSPPGQVVEEIPEDLAKALEWYLGTSQGLDDGQAHVLFEKAGETGNPLARMWLARLYHMGRCGFPKETEKAVRLAQEVIDQIEKLAEDGNPQAQFLLASAFGDGLSLSKDVQKAFYWNQKAAEKGLPVAMNSLGKSYATGQGVARDFTQARYWFQKAAEKDLPEAMKNLGFMYSNGDGVAQDYTQAFYWYQKAAEKDHPMAMNSLGKSYAIGQGVARDFTQARYWFQKAAEKDLPEAMKNLGFMYSNGDGVARDYTQAVNWYQKAAEKNFTPAMHSLGLMYENGRGVAKDCSQAVYWYQKAAEKNYTPAMHNLGWMHQNGRCVAKDLTQARYWYQKAAEKDDPMAMNNLGLMYEHGLGGAKDKQKAEYWLRRGAEKGDKNAKKNLARRGAETGQADITVKSEKNGPKARLFINPKPEDAKIRILNIGPRYQAGMELDPGRYHIEVSHQGNFTLKKWIELKAGQEVHVEVTLW